MLLLICALTPLLLGGALPFLRIRKRSGRMIYVMAAACLTSVLTGYVIISGYTGAIELFRLSDQFICALRLDGAGRVYLGLAALLWPLATLYAVEYMRHEEREGNFFCWYLIAYSAAVLLSAADNLFTLYVFYELLTMCTVPLVWHKQDDQSTHAALIYMLYLIGAAAMGFVAMVGLQQEGLEAFRLGGSIKQMNQWTEIFVLLALLGFGAKAALFPLCHWLPTASVAPTPVTALLHAVAVVNAGVFSVMRILYYAVGTEKIQSVLSLPVHIVMILAVFTILLGAVMAVREQHVKKRLAWSTVSNLSYMLFGLCIGCFGENAGMAAGMAHMVFHGITKIILFFCIGAVTIQTGRTHVRQMHGLGKKMPVVFLCYTLAGVSLVGIPPLPVFVSKYALISSAFQNGSTGALIGSISLLAAAVLTVIYIFSVVYPAFFMKLHLDSGEDMPRDPGPCIKISLVLLCALLLLSGAFAGKIMAYLTSLAEGSIV